VSQFEYVSVAVALVYALVVGRVLAGITPALARDRRYLVHAGWLVQILLVCVLQWWTLWRTSDVEWTAIRFLWILSIPSLQYIRAAILLGASESIDSYRDHFYAVRRMYFSVGLLNAAQGILGSWVLGAVPWLTLAPGHAGMPVLAAISLVGLISSNEVVHKVLVGVSLLLAAALFALPPPLPTPA
jgi:hypothetical protein